jgi:hypothetical protein
MYAVRSREFNSKNRRTMEIEMTRATDQEKASSRDYLSGQGKPVNLLG